MRLLSKARTSDSTFAPRPSAHPSLSTSCLPQGGDGDDTMSAPGGYPNLIYVCPASSLPHHSQPFFLQEDWDIMPFGLGRR